MRGDTNKERLEEFMRFLGRSAHEPARIYFTGGTTALLFGWRESTVDVDLKFDPERDELFRLVSKIKDVLDINIELASPPDFIPEVPGWAERSIFIAREGRLDFYHYDPYSQALSKVERGHAQDLDDVDSMFHDELIVSDKLDELFKLIESQLYRYPAIDPAKFRRSLDEILAKQKRAE